MMVSIGSRCLRCGECCYAFEVPEINKPGMSQCKHFSRDENGLGVCHIYSKRPFSCRIFILPDADGVCALGKIKRRKDASR